MSRISRLAVFCFLSSISLSAYALSLQGFTFGKEIMYLESASGTQWIYAADQQRPIASETQFERHAFDPHFKWAWRWYVTYALTPHNDINIHLTHYRDDVEEDMMAKASRIPLLTYYVSGIVSTRIQAAKETKFDSVSLEFGHHDQFTQKLTFRSFFGLQWARVYDMQHLRPDYNSQRSISGIFFYNNHSSFYGTGVRAGMSGAYDLGHNFSFVFDGSAALLVGNLKNHVKVSEDFTDYDNEVPQTIRHEYYYDSRHPAIVPTTEASVSVHYLTQLINRPFDIGFGFRVINLFDAIESTTHVPNTYIARKQGVNGENDIVTDHNFNLYGIFAIFKYTFNS